MTYVLNKAMESRARRAAKTAGLHARKSRLGSPIDNAGGFQLIDPDQNYIVAGEKFDLTSEEVIEVATDRHAVSD